MVRQIYLAYGTNIPSSLMANRAKDAKKLGWGFIPDHQLIFGSGGFATIVPRAGAKAPVAIWAVSDRDMKQLDFYESYPRYYDKKLATVELADSSAWGNLNVQEDNSVEVELHPKTVQGTVYYMRGDYKVAYPNSSAVRAAEVGYDEFGMPKEYLTEAITLSDVLCGRELWEVYETWNEAEQ